MWLTDAPIRRKLTAIMLLTGGVVALLSCVVFLAYELLTFRHTIVRSGGIAASVVVASFLVAYLFSRILQRHILQPILALAETAKHVSERQDYSLRAVRFGHDEVGALTDSFNDMLGQISDLRRTRQAVVQQEQLRALGRMVSGIAHDINNTLSPVALYAELLLEREAGISEKGRSQLVTIQRAIEGAAQTVLRMREFYRQREPQMERQRVDLNRLVDQVVSLTRARWNDLPQGRGVVIDLETELAADLPAVMGAENEIRDALTNLIFNAVDAMPDGGALRLRTRLVSAVEGEPHRDSADRVYLEVCDTGVGMDDDTRRRCLEPFFTTKGERGTGLGLAMVLDMAQRHGASLEIESEPGQDTTVRLIFLVATAAGAAQVA